MQRITERQRELLSNKTVSITAENMDFYALGRNTRIVYGDDLKLAQRVIDEEAHHATNNNVDDFFDGYWYGVEALLAALPEEDVIIDVKIQYQGHEWSGKLNPKEAFVLSIKDIIKKEQDPIWALVEMAIKGNEINSGKNEKEEPCFSIVPAQWHGIF